MDDRTLLLVAIVAVAIFVVYQSNYMEKFSPTMKMRPTLFRSLNVLPDVDSYHGYLRAMNVPSYNSLQSSNSCGCSRKLVYNFNSHVCSYCGNQNCQCGQQR